MSLPFLLSRLKVELHQVRQILVARNEDVQCCSLDLILVVLTLSGQEQLVLVQASGSPEGRSEKDHTGGRREDPRPIDVVPLRISDSLTASTCFRPRPLNNSPGQQRDHQSSARRI